MIFFTFLFCLFHLLQNIVSVKMEMSSVLSWHMVTCSCFSYCPEYIWHFRAHWSTVYFQFIIATEIVSEVKNTVEKRWNKEPWWQTLNVNTESINVVIYSTSQCNILENFFFLQDNYSETITLFTYVNGIRLTVKVHFSLQTVKILIPILQFILQWPQRQINFLIMNKKKCYQFSTSSSKRLKHKYTNRPSAIQWLISDCFLSWINHKLYFPWIAEKHMGKYIKSHRNAKIGICP